jgi:polysaccharide export outer membrane protein
MSSFAAKGDIQMPTFQRDRITAPNMKCSSPCTIRSDRHTLTGKKKPGFVRCLTRVLSALAVTAAILNAGCAHHKGTLPPNLRGPSSSGDLARGDVVKLSFPGAPELNQSQKIRADGKVSLPLVGEVEAAGKRIGAFQEELTRLYKSQLKNSDVVVTLDSSSTPIYVSGAVNRPGKVILDRPMTILEAIMEAGGVTNLANMHKVVVIRNGKDTHFTQTFDLSATLRGHNAASFNLRPYDMIYVSERFF